MPPYYQEFLLAKAFGWTPAEIAEQPAVVVDWLLAMNGAVAEVEAAAARPKPGT